MAVEEARVMLIASGCIQTVLDREHSVLRLQREINNSLYARAHRGGEVGIGFVMNVRPSVRMCIIKCHCKEFGGI
jgi:hypothetical protein